jgi:hypothetical protein
VVGADAGALYRLLRALSGLGVVEERDGRTFALTELGELLKGDALGGSRSRWAPRSTAPPGRTW